MVEDKAVAEQANAIQSLRQESARLKSNADLFSMTGTSTMLGGVAPSTFSLGSGKAPPKWMSYAGVALSVTSIAYFVQSLVNRGKAHTIDQTLDKIPTLWEEKIKKRPEVDTKIEK